MFASQTRRCLRVAGPFGALLLQQSPNFANYDESKVAPYPPLPELMVTKAGTRVTTAKQWRDVRRPELVELFDREVYGRMPTVTPKVSWTVTNTSEETDGGVTLVKKELLGAVDNSSYPQIAVNIEAAVWTPKDAKGPVPVVLEFGSGGRPQPPRQAPVASAPPAGGERPGRQRRRAHRGHHRPRQQGPAA